MTSVHPLSQAEADRVFSQEDRAQAAQRKQSPNVRQLTKDLRNCDQRLERNHKHAGTALWNWFEGDPRGLVHYEKCAERIQLDLYRRDSIVTRLRKAFEDMSI